MAIEQRDNETLVQDILDTIVENRTNSDISLQTVINDMARGFVIGALGPLWDDAYLTYINLILENVDQLIADGTLDVQQLEAFGRLFGVERRAPVQARGDMQFIVPGTPTSNQVIPASTIVSAELGTNSETLLFTVTESVILDANDIGSYLVPELGVYAITAPILASAGGSQYNLSAGTITTLNTPVIGIASVTHILPTFGGLNLETDSQLALRIRDRMFRAIGISQPGGINAFLQDEGGVTELVVLRAGDSRVLRKTGSGVADVYVKDIQEERVAEDISHDGSDSIILLNQPVLSINYVRTAAGTALIQGLDYTLEKDTNFLAHSSLAQDKVVFTSPPTVGTVLTISYQFNENPLRLSALVNSEDYYVPSRDILVFEAIRIPLYLSCVVQRDSTPSTTVEQAVRNSVIAYVEANSSLGDQITQSGIITAISSATGVIAVDLPSLELRKLTDPSGNTGDVTIGDNSYAVVAPENILVSFLN